MKILEHQNFLINRVVLKKMVIFLNTCLTTVLKLYSMGRNLASSVILVR